MIAAGRVCVGGRSVRDPDWRVDLELDAIAIDGRPTAAAARAHWLLHKPVGYVTTRRDPDGRPTVYDLLPPDAPFVTPVGRLDLQSSGLILFTNDTRLGSRLTDPRTHVPKVYEIVLDRPVDRAAALRLAEGIRLQGVRTRPARFELCDPEPSYRMRVTLVEGRNRQIRRMFETLGCNVVRLCRVAIGPLKIDSLAAGEIRPLRAAEIRALRRAAGLE